MSVSYAKPQSTRYQMNSWFAWVVCMVGALFFFYEFLQMNIFNPISQDLLQAFNIDSTGLGYLSSMYFYGDFLIVIPAGMLLDRYSTKLLIFISMLACSIATVVFAFTDSFYIASFARFVEGLGAGFCFLASIRLASRWFTANHLAFVTGAIVTMAMLGGMVAQTPMAFLTEHYGWRYAMVLNGVLGLIIMAVIMLVVKDRPNAGGAEVKSEESHLKKFGVMHSLWFVLKNRNNWFGGLYTTLMNLPIFILGALWGMMYLEQIHGLSHDQASYVTSVLFIGVIFGSPFFGWFSDRIRSRKKPMILGALSSLVVVLILLYVPGLSLTSLLVLSFLLGFLTSSQIISYPAVAELNPIELTGSVVSIISLTIMASGAIVQPLTGWLIQLHWDHHTMLNDKPLYLASDYNAAMIVMPISFVVSLLFACIMKETGCKSEYEHLK